MPRRPQSGELLLEVIAAGIGPRDALLHTGGWDVGLLPGSLGVEGGRVFAQDTPLPVGSGSGAQQVIVRASNAAACLAHLSPWSLLARSSPS